MHDAMAVEATKSYLARKGLSLKKSTLTVCKKSKVVNLFRSNECFESFLKAASITITLQLIDLHSKPTSGLGTSLYHYFTRDLPGSKILGSRAPWGEDPCHGEYASEDWSCQYLELRVGAGNEAVEPTSLAKFTKDRDAPEDLCGSHEGCVKDLNQYCIDGRHISHGVECEEQVAWLLTGKSKVMLSWLRYLNCSFKNVLFPVKHRDV